ncbi:MAG: hypothetical protein AAB706_01220 [Patescibacteria group bacterium]
MFFPDLHFNTRNIIGRILSAAFVFSLVFQPLLLLAEESQTPTSEVQTGDGGVVVTGDAVALTDAGSTVNTNEVNQAGTETPETQNNTENTAESSSLNTNLTNEATVENTATTSATTGENTATGDNGAIITGDAYAGANVFNLVNTNIIDSYTLFFLLNYFFGLEGNIDLRDFQNASTSPSFPSCGNGECLATSGSSSEISAQNTASISNTLVVRANTGENETGEDGLIATGNAYAGANVINVANTNIVNSNYLLFTLNNFGGWGGDLVLPNGDFFTNFFFRGNGSTPANTDISIDNSASIENNVSTDANTGNNEAEGGLIVTGDASSGANVFNQVNSNLFGGSKLHILVRIHGNWLGNVFNAPPGVSWRETATGVELFGLPEENGTDSSFSPLSNFKLNAQNTASISNNVGVYALTGDNKTSGGETYTGNAYAAANIINVANSNVIGQNWILAILNIFGDWSGNVSFGQPDLWIGTQVTVPEKNFFGVGETVRYNYTIANRGDATASGVTIQNTFDRKEFMAFENGYNFQNPDTGQTSWNIPDIPAGGIVRVSYNARVLGVPFKDTSITSNVVVSSTETDADVKDNREKITITAHDYVPGWNGVKVTLTPDPKLIVTKTNDVFFPTAGTTTANYRIFIKNKGGIAHHAVLVDTLKNEAGDILKEQEWELGDVYPNEEIEVTYTSIFSGKTPPGVYTNEAQVKAVGRHPSLTAFYGYVADSNIATSSITIIPPYPWASEITEAPEKVATTTPSTVTSSTGRFINPEPSSEIISNPVISEMPPYIPFSPLLSKVLAFRDSVESTHTGGGQARLPSPAAQAAGGQGASAFSALGLPSETKDFFLLLVALFLSFIISNLLSRTRLRNAFTSF